MACRLALALWRTVLVVGTVSEGVAATGSLLLRSRHPAVFLERSVAAQQDPSGQDAANELSKHLSNILSNTQDSAPSEQDAANERILHHLRKVLRQSTGASTSHEENAVPSFASDGGDGGDPAEIKNLENVVGDLVRKRQKDGKTGKATPLGPGEKHISNIIDNTLLPARKRAYAQDQAKLDWHIKEFDSCVSTKSANLKAAKRQKIAYKTNSRRHKSCRMQESGEYLEMSERCMKTAMEAKELGAQAVCQEVETAQKYKYCDYSKITDAEAKCDKVKKEVRYAKRMCDSSKSRYDTTVSKCNSFQAQMDQKACSHAVAMKDACQDYGTCYKIKLDSFETAKKQVEKAEQSRSGEWRALKRMQCLMKNFADGRVTDQEVDACKKRSWTAPSINYPETPSKDGCTIPKQYPSTAEYKRAEFAGLPPQAKGKPDAGNCFAMSVLK